MTRAARFLLALWVIAGACLCWLLFLMWRPK